MSDSQEGAINIQVEVEGLSILERRLGEAGDQIGPITKAVTRTASELLTAATLRKAPIGDKTKDEHPGLLASTIRAGSTLHTGYVSIGSSQTPYTKPVIFGWHRRNIQSNRFPYRALDETREEIEHLYERGIESLLARSFGG